MEILKGLIEFIPNIIEIASNPIGGAISIGLLVVGLPVLTLVGDFFTQALSDIFNLINNGITRAIPIKSIRDKLFKRQIVILEKSKKKIDLIIKRISIRIKE